jgi:hypothetical protein
MTLIMAGTPDHQLKVVLALKWVRDSVYDAKVSVTVPDSCYVADDLKIGLPPGMVGIPEIEYLTFNITHKSGPCSDVVRTLEKSIEITLSAAKRSVTAFAVVAGKVAGEDTKLVPRK